MATVDVSSGSKGDREFDHEPYAGMVIADPWDDPEQTDWPMATDAEKEVRDGVGSDNRPEDLA